MLHTETYPAISITKAIQRVFESEQSKLASICYLHTRNTACFVNHIVI